MPVVKLFSLQSGRYAEKLWRRRILIPLCFDEYTSLLYIQQFE
jgi:hypothetical protein